MLVRNTILIIVILTFNHFECLSQFKNSNWCFGDSARIDFSDPQTPVVLNSSVNSRGSAVSISNGDDTLIFYANTGAGTGIQRTLVYNRLNQLMINGNNIIGLGWYHELLIIPFPDNPDFFYLFTAGVTTTYGIYYSIIDISLNNGLGEIIQKNIPLQSFPVADGITAIKHGNGRDWWIVFRPADPINMQNWSNTFYTYLISPSGISILNDHNVGTLFVSNLHRLTFNREGNKILAVDAGGIVELYDFDRCTAIFSNPVNIAPVSAAPFPFYWDAEFSPSGQFLYISANPDTSYIFQYDLLAPDIAASKDTIWSAVFPAYCGGHLKIAPDSNIYYGTTYYNGFQFPYPYADSVYNVYNMNLGVIHEPDSAGMACNFQPWSFYLGGYRTYGGLPNNPDYEMGPLSGSPCDTLTGIEELTYGQASMFISYHSEWQMAFVNLKNLEGKNFFLQVSDLSGKSIYSESGILKSTFFTRDVFIPGKAKSIYVIRFETEKEKLFGKFVNH